MKNNAFLLLFSLLVMYSCKKSDDDSSPTPVHLEVGQQYQGGVIAYIDPSGQHGLIASPSDLTVTINWSDTIQTGATGTIIGSGQDNTNTIIAHHGKQGFYVALECDKYEENGYSDWYLPSKDELYQLYKNRVAIGGFKKDPNASPYTTMYWSSSEYSKTRAWCLNFYDGTLYSGASNFSGSYTAPNKKYNYLVRPVRSF
jgi:hypothetical protein